jgi:hypothetical protein
MKTNLRKAMSTWPLVIFLPFPPLTRAVNAIATRVQPYNGPGNCAGQANALALDRGDGSFEFDDANVSKFSGRFYRIKQMPG